MTPKEAAVVLAKAATVDNRKPTPEAAVTWARVLGDVPLIDALAAVEAHYAESSDWILPGHVLRRVDAVRAARLLASPEPALPPDLSGSDYRDALRVERRQVANGGASDVARAVEAVGRRELTQGGAS